MVLKNQLRVSKLIFKIYVVATLVLFFPVLSREERACEVRNSSSLETNILAKYGRILDYGLLERGNV
jgi:hypothetical protein